jgi:hypothetical protein
MNRRALCAVGLGLSLGVPWQGGPFVAAQEGAAAPAGDVVATRTGSVAGPLDARRREQVDGLVRDADRALQISHFAEAAGLLRQAAVIEPENEKVRLLLRLVEDKLNERQQEGERARRGGGDAAALQAPTSRPRIHVPEGPVVAMLEARLLMVPEGWLEEHHKETDVQVPPGKSVTLDQWKLNRLLTASQAERRTVSLAFPRMSFGRDGYARAPTKESSFAGGGPESPMVLEARTSLSTDRRVLTVKPTLSTDGKAQEFSRVEMREGDTLLLDGGMMTRDGGPLRGLLLLRPIIPAHPETAPAPPDLH